MNSKDIQNLLDQLADCIRDGNMGGARDLAGDIFTGSLKSVYAQIRGQASAGIMRGLLELEIQIGGEDGDFRTFDPVQMADLFVRGGLTGLMETLPGRWPALSATVDVGFIARWLQASGSEGERAGLSSVRFMHAWLVLFAEENGILEPGEASAAERFGSSKATRKASAALPDVGKPYTEPVTGMRLVFIPGNTFSMGDTFDEGVEDEKPVHAVTLSDYYMTDCPVTQAQWKALMADNPSSFAGDDHPVEQVTLIDVQAFLDKLNAASESGLHFDLPSEAQWEYAARSGGKDELYAGGPDPEAVACYEGNSSGGTDPVGGKAPNGLGLYDMSGNVWEWCRDIYHPEAYRRHEKKDPVCNQGGTDRVIRGGSWHLDAWSARCSRRFRFDPDLFGPALGFRVVMVIDG
jgi:formylglycine-generating enzyme required for sulfatase activity